MHIAASGRAGQRFSHAPHPRQRASSTTGTLGDFGFFGSFATIEIAPDGHWRKQLSHGILSVFTMQRSECQTALPICSDDCWAGVIGSIAPAGQTFEHSTQSTAQ